MSTEFIKIKNWSALQSYKDRKPPWIRFHKTILDNYEFQMMSFAARALLPMLWLLASEHDDPTSGLIEDSYKKIAFRLRCTEDEIISVLEECEQNGFLNVVDEKKQKNNQQKTTNKKTTKKTEENQGLNKIRNEIPKIRNDIVTKFRDSVTPETETETETETESVVGKCVEKRKNEIEFEEFWIQYGKIGNKQPANKSYFKQIKKGAAHEEIINGLGRYQKYCRKLGTKQEYIKHASRWLNEEGFRDEYTIHKEERSSENRQNAALQRALDGDLYGDCS